MADMVNKAHDDFKKFDQDKPRTDLLQPLALLEVAKVSGYGAKKYADNNWRNCKDVNRYTAAALRHTLQHLSGELMDPETGYHHLAHAAWSLLSELELMLVKKIK